MASKRKRGVKLESHESSGYWYDPQGQKHRDNYGIITDSLLRSAAAAKLTSRQIVLLSVCKLQLAGKHRPIQDLDLIEDIEARAAVKELAEYTFYLTWQGVQPYNLYGRGCEKAFYKDMHALIDAGFLRKLTSVATRKEDWPKTVYLVVSNWHTRRKQNNEQ